MEDDWDVDDWAGDRSEEEYANFFEMSAEDLKEYREAHGLSEEEAKLQERMAWEVKVHGRPSRRTIEEIAKAQGVDPSLLPESFDRPDPQKLIDNFDNTGSAGAGDDEFNEVDINDTWVLEISALGATASATFELMNSESEETPEVMKKWWKGNNVFTASVIMARWLAMQPAPTPIVGKTVVELGAGIGLPGITAALLGAERVLLTEYYSPGLQEGMKSAVHNGVGKVVTGLRGNWTDLPDRLLNAEEEDLQHFKTPDLIIGSDILFEQVEASQVAEVLSKMLKTPDQVAQIMDPYRRLHKRHFAKECKKHGLDVEKAEVCTWEPENSHSENTENWFCDLFTVRRPA